MTISPVTVYTGTLPTAADPSTFDARMAALMEFIVQVFGPEFAASIGQINSAFAGADDVTTALAALTVSRGYGAAAAPLRGRNDAATISNDGFAYANAGTAGNPTSDEAYLFLRHKGAGDTVGAILAIGQTSANIHIAVRNAGAWGGWVQIPRAGNAAGNVPVLVGAGGLLEAARIPNGVGARLIRTVNIPSAVASVDFTSADMDLTKYSDFVFVLRNILPVTNNVRLWLRTSADGGTTFAAAAGTYAHANTGSNSSPNNGAGGAISATQADLSFANTSNAASGGGLSGEVMIVGCDLAFRQKWMFRTSHWRGDVSAFENTNGGGIRLADAVINGARFMFSSGNIAGNANSSISIYGVAK